MAAKLAAGILLGVDVDVPLAGKQVRGLGIGQGGRQLDRAQDEVERQHDAGVLALSPGPCRCAPMAGPLRPEKVTLAEKLFVTVSKLASAAPVAALLFGGTSFVPLRSALSMTVSANAGEAPRQDCPQVSQQQTLSLSTVSCVFSLAIW